MKVLGIIPARGGSKRLKNKNIMDFNGKPLIGYTIEAALKSKLIDKVVVSTDCDEITGVVNEAYDIEVIKRPVEFAKDDSPIEEALLHAVEHVKEVSGYEADIVVWMQANVPIRKEGEIDEAVEKLINSDADSCVTCQEASEVPEVMKIINKEGMLVPVYKGIEGIRKQEFPDRYLLDGSIVAIRTKNLVETKGVRKAHIYLGDKTIPIIHEDKKYSLEVDTESDASLVKYFLNKRSQI